MPFREGHFIKNILNESIMPNPAEEMRKRISALIILSRERELSSDEMEEFEHCIALLGSSKPGELSKELLEPDWLKENFEMMEKIEQSKKEAWKKIWDAIAGGEGK